MTEDRPQVRPNRPWASLNWPNRITLARLFMVAPFIALLLNQDTFVQARHLALLIFMVMAASDLLDGVLARKLHQRTRLGMMMDPLADKVLIVCSVVLLSIPETSVPCAKISNWVVVAVVAKDAWVLLGFTVIYLLTGQARVHTVRAGKVSTFAQLAMVTFVLVAPDLNGLVSGLGTRLASVAAWIAACLSVVAIVSYTRVGLELIAESDRPVNSNNGGKVVTDEHD